MLNIGLTGGTGFIGKAVINHFDKDNEINVYSINRKRISINDRTNLVIHLAGLAHDLSSNYSKEEYDLANYELTKKVFEVFLTSQAETFLFVSTSKIYGDNGVFDESSIPNPKSAYSYSKLKAESFLLNQIGKYNKKIIILRPALVYNKEAELKGNLNLLKQYVRYTPIIIFPKFGERRSYCSLNNFFEIIIYLKNQEIKSGIYNVADNEAFSSFEVIRAMNKTYRKPIIVIPKSIYILMLSMVRIFHPKIKIYNNKLFSSFIIDNSKLRDETNLEFDQSIIK